MKEFQQLDDQLRTQATESESKQCAEVYAYAKAIAEIENVIAVVSDLSERTSRIFSGGFSQRLGLSGYSSENSIWEKGILARMTEHEQRRKFISELQFYNYVRRKCRGRSNYYLLTHLKLKADDGTIVNTAHRMHYVYGTDGKTIRYAICLYGPVSEPFSSAAYVVDSLTGFRDELSPSPDDQLLSQRERQVLSLISAGMKTKEIAERLHISPHTVSRHRQEILSRLQVKNSIEACRMATSMGII